MNRQKAPPPLRATPGKGLGPVNMAVGAAAAMESCAVGAAGYAGIKKVKTGAKGTEPALLIDANLWLRMVMCVFLMLGMLAGAVYFNRNYANTLLKQVDMVAENRRRAVHRAAIQMLEMGTELETHLTQEVKWEHIERQLAERQQELEEDMRMKVSKSFYEQYDAMAKALKDAGTAGEERNKMVAEWRLKIYESMDQAFEKYGNDMETLSKSYVKKASTEAGHDHTRLLKIKGMLAMVGDMAKDTLQIDGDNDSGDDDLDEVLKRFFDCSDNYAEGHEKEVWMPREVEDELKMLRSDFERQNPAEVIDRVHKLLFPGGKAFDEAGESVYGVPKFDGGSIEEYLDTVLFGSDFMLNEYSVLEQTRQDWEAGDIESIDVLQTITAKVANGTVPAEWLSDSLEQLDPGDDGSDILSSLF